MKSLSDCRLYTFVDTAYLHGRSPAEVARQLCEGGSDIIQLRAKTDTRENIQKMAEAIVPITREHGIPLVINDYLEIADAIRAECVHLGQEDFFDAGFKDRSELSPLNCWLGLSSHAPEQAKRAVAAGANYVAVGPVFATGTKPGRPAVTLEYVRWAAENIALPWFAIGGIHLGNLKKVLSAGATRVCVVSAILNATDVRATCREFKKQLNA